MPRATPGRKPEMAGTIERRIGVDYMFLERGGCEEDLEHGARRVHVLVGAIEHAVRRALQNIDALTVGVRADEDVWVVAGTARQREYCAGVRVEHDDRAVFRFEETLAMALQPDIERETHGLAGRRLLFFLEREAVTETVHEIFDVRIAKGIGTDLRRARGEFRHEHVSVAAVQLVLEPRLDAGTADEVAHLVAILGAFEFGLVDLAQVAQKLAGGFSVNVAAQRAHDGEHARQRVGVFVDAGRDRRGHVVPHEDLLVRFAGLARLGDARAQRRGVNTGDFLEPRA